MSYEENRSKEVDYTKFPLTKVQRVLLEMRLWNRFGWSPKDTGPMNDADLVDLVRVLDANKEKEE